VTVDRYWLDTGVLTTPYGTYDEDAET